MTRSIRIYDIARALDEAGMAYVEGGWPDESARGDARWSTVGCSSNIIEASWLALWDSLELPLHRFQ